MPEPPGQLGLVGRLAVLERRLAELSRSGGNSGPVCTVHLASDVGVPGATNVAMYVSWKPTAEVDTHDIWRYSVDGGSFMLLPNAGRWLAHFHIAFPTALTGFDGNGRVVPNAVAGKIMRNGTVPTAHSVGTAAAMFSTYNVGTAPGEGTSLDVWVDHYVFSAGDRLYFGVWSRYPTSVLAQMLGVPTHATVRYLGPE